MEIELKYAIHDPETLEAIWEDKDLMAIEEKGSRQVEDYFGVYYDSEDYRLLAHDVVLRVRKEACKYMATLKWNGHNKGALHKREELNIRVGEEDLRGGVRPEIFQESDVGQKVLALLEGRPLQEIMNINVLRKSFRVDTGKSLLELCFDRGEIITAQGRKPVLELEIELYSGEQEDLEQIGQKIQNQYGLKSENQSKFARGLAMMPLTQKEEEQ